MSNKVITVDVRDDIRGGREPFAKIMSAASTLQPGEELRLIAPFEPVPLFHLLAKQGFQQTAQAIASGDWEVLFSRQVASSPSAVIQVAAQPKSPNTNGQNTAAVVVEVDARGLEPPQPLVKILEALATLPEVSELHARTDRRPMHLYPQLEERGFAAETKEQSDGSFLTQIRRN